MLSRRTLIGNLISFVAAPAIVRVSSIMPVKAMEPLRYMGIDLAFDEDTTYISFIDGTDWKLIMQVAAVDAQTYNIVSVMRMR